MKDSAKGSNGFTTWTFWPGRHHSYLIEGIEQVWLNKITTDAYLGHIQTAVQPGIEGRQGSPLPPRTA